jgi:hypothetical protein
MDLALYKIKLNFIFGILLAFLAQCLTFAQLQGQFLSEWVKSHPLLFSLLGVPISYFFIKATHYFYLYFDGFIWPGRLIGFSLGILAFSLLSYFLMGESPTMKTWICIGLSVVIVMVQIFWK